MSHKIVTTEGLVLKSRDYGESNRIFWIYTRELGLVRALARSVREMRSKIRGTIEDFTIAKISLVEGREIWRVVNVIESSHGAGFLNEEGKMRVLTRVSALLLRFIQGEESNPELFDEIVGALTYLRALDCDEYKDLELLLFLRILYKLGHVDKTVTVGALFDRPFDEEILGKISMRRREVALLIKQSLEGSHL